MSKPDYKLLYKVENDSEHSHDYAQILLPVNTEIHVSYKNAAYIVGPRELCFIPPNVPHQCLCENKLVVIDIPPIMIKKGDLQVLSRKAVMPIDDSMAQLTELIRAEAKNNRSGMRYLYYYFYELLVENNSYRSIRYIREHFDEPISVEKLARLENYNPTYFNAWFKKQTGYTPSHYLKLYRIEKAKELLMYSTYSVLEIALQVGYGSHSAFSRTFKEETGCSPFEYRQNFIRDIE